MSARPGTQDALDDSDMIFELKIDGIRCVCYKDGSDITLLSRNGIWFHYKFPEIVMDLQRSVNAERAVIDGEIYVPDADGNPSFQMLSRRIHLDGKDAVDSISMDMPAIYAVFDVMSVDGKDVTSHPLIDRKKILDRVISDSANIVKLPYSDDGRSMWKFVQWRGLEGIIAKKKQSMYEPGERSYSWLKVKSLKTMDVIVLGYVTGSGRRKDIGSILTGCYHRGRLVYTGMVGTGLSEREWTELLEKLKGLPETGDPFRGSADIRVLGGRRIVWVEQKYVVEVRFMHLTEQMILRAASILRMRDDKDPKECVLEDQLSLKYI